MVVISSATVMRCDGTSTNLFKLGPATQSPAVEILIDPRTIIISR